MIPLHPHLFKIEGPGGIIPPGGVWGSAPTYTDWVLPPSVREVSRGGAA
jgi:hypothetical protein